MYFVLEEETPTLREVTLLKSMISSPDLTTQVSFCSR